MKKLFLFSYLLLAISSAYAVNFVPTPDTYYNIVQTSSNLVIGPTLSGGLSTTTPVVTTLTNTKAQAFKFVLVTDSTNVYNLINKEGMYLNKTTVNQGTWNDTWNVAFESSNGGWSSQWVIVDDASSTANFRLANIEQKYGSQASTTKIYLASDAITLNSVIYADKLVDNANGVFTAQTAVDNPTFIILEQNVIDIEKKQPYPLTIVAVNQTYDINVTATAGFKILKTVYSPADFTNNRVDVPIYVDNAAVGDSGKVVFSYTDGTGIHYLDTALVTYIAPAERYYITQKASGLVIGNYAGTTAYPSLTTLSAAGLISQRFLLRPVHEGVTDNLYYIVQDGTYHMLAATGDYDTEFGVSSTDAIWKIVPLADGATKTIARYNSLSYTNGKMYLGSDSIVADSSRLYYDKVYAAGGKMEWLIAVDTIIVKYKNQSGITIKADRKVTEGLTEGSIYTALASDKTGITVGNVNYAYDATSTDNAVVLAGNTTIVLKFIPPTVTIKYQNQSGETLQPDRVISSGITAGDTYIALTSDKVGITVGSVNYAYDATSNDNALVFAGNATIVLKFIAPTVTIKYQNQSGETLQPDRVISSGITAGDTYTALASDKTGITVGNVNYAYDATSNDNALVFAGNATIVLKFIAPTVTDTLKPYTALSNVRPYYIIGLGDGEWNISIDGLGVSMYPMSLVSGNNYDANGDGLFTFTGYFDASRGFKLIRDIGSWSEQWGMLNGSFDHNNLNSDNITVPTNGYYTIRLNSIDNILTMTAATTAPSDYGTMGLVGGFNNWTSDIKMNSSESTNNHEWYTIYKFESNDSCKFRANDAWDANWGANEFPYGIGVQNGANILCNAGIYIMLLNDIDGCYYFINQSTYTVNTTYTVTVPIGTKACYLSGVMNNWGFTQMTKTDDTHYTITLISSTSYGYKYCSGPGWDYVEMDASGNTIPNRTYSANDVVASWAGIYDPSITTGSDEMTGNDNSYILYPNPTIDGFYLITGEKTTPISIYDLNGTLILAKQVSDKEFVNISTFKQGVYIIKIQTERGKIVKKLVKE